MKIEDFLSPTDALVDVRASDGARLIQELAARAAVSIGVNATRIAQELAKREALGSTGVGNGVAMPHARMPEVQKPFGMLARLKKPIEFDAIDRAPVDIVFLLLLPAAPSEHLNVLAAVARQLREPDRLVRLRSASDAAAMYRELVQ